MTLVEKENDIKDLLNEMNLEQMRELGFNNLYVESYIENTYQEGRERFGSVDGFKTVINDKFNKTSIYRLSDRFNNICLEKTFIKDGFLNITYDVCKKAIINIDSISKIYAMKTGDNNVY